MSITIPVLDSVFFSILLVIFAIMLVIWVYKLVASLLVGG